MPSSGAGRGARVCGYDGRRTDDVGFVVGFDFDFGFGFGFFVMAFPFVIGLRPDDRRKRADHGGADVRIHRGPTTRDRTSSSSFMAV
jgi:hypothetical protein